MREITFYDFDLDMPVENRWGLIFDAYADQLPELKNKLRTILDSFGIASTLVKPIYSFTPEDNIMHYDEIRYISQRIGLSPFEVLLMQLIYETSSACTSTVLKVGPNEFFLRTMDWPMLFLKDITIGLNIKKNNKVIGKAITWLGYVGFLTGTNAVKDYTIAINYRTTTEISVISLVKNLRRTIGLKWPIGYLVRRIVEENLAFYDAQKMLETAELISPCYITIYVPNYQTYMITRDCDKLVDTRTDNLVQTNCDWNKLELIRQGEPNILWSLERISQVEVTQDLINEINENQDLTTDDILKFLIKHPIYNEETIYVHYQYMGKYVTLV